VAARLVVARDVAAWRDPDHASSAHLRARARDPEVPAAQRLSSLRELRRVQGELADLVERGPRPHARLRLAELCNLTGQHGRAAEHARACLAHWRDHLRATLQLAEALGLGGHGQRAHALLEQIAERAPVTPHVRAHLLACTGEAWRRSGDGAQADECFGAALLLEPGQVLALNGRARQALETGDFDGATRDLLVAAQVEPLRADTWSNLGRALVLSGAHEQGSSMLARALSINPTHREARVLLERVALMRTPRERVGHTRACG
jgi:Flp pilus assembly protein TadD